MESYRSKNDYYQQHYDHQPLNAAHISYYSTLLTSFRGGNDVGLDPTKHAIARTEATAIKAAAAVAKLTSSGRFMTTTSSVTCVSRTGAASRNREEQAAILIQSHFRTYLVSIMLYSIFQKYFTNRQQLLLYLSSSRTTLTTTITIPKFQTS